MLLGHDDVESILPVSRVQGHYKDILRLFSEQRDERSSLFRVLLWRCLRMNS